MLFFSVGNGYQTAIDKVKQNEALTHPKQHEKLMQQKLKISSNQSPSSPTSSSDTNPPNPELQSNMKNTKNNNIGGKDFHEKNGRHMSIITMADSANNDNKSKDKGGSSLSSGMEGGGVITIDYYRD